MAWRTGVLLGFLSISTAFFLSARAADKMSVPDAASRAEAQKHVAGVFGDTLAKARTPKDKAAVADKMLTVAAESTDPAQRFVLLEMARDLAAAGGNAKTAMSAIEQLTDLYKVDKPLDMKAEAFGKLVSNSDSSLVEKILAAAEEAVAADDFSLASTFLRLASAGARRASDPGLTGLIATRSNEIRQIREAYIRAKGAIDVLASNPSDEAASSAAGSYQCFFKGDWAKGLPMLAKGSLTDEALKTAVSLEIQKPSEAGREAELGDLWWAVGEKNQGLARTQIRLHAADLYRRAMPRQSGLRKADLAKRIEEATGIPADPLARDLTRMTPVSVKVGWKALTVSKPISADGNPGPSMDGKACEPYLGAAAPSCIVYKLPPWARGRKFLARGWMAAPDSNGVEFIVRIDGKEAYKSRMVDIKNPWVEIGVWIPPRAENLELVVGDLGDNHGDRSYWVQPRIE